VGRTEELRTFWSTSTN